MLELDISEVSQRSGLPASTLRYYEQRGLIRPLGRKGLRRVYAPTVMQTLALVTLGRTAGFALEEIAAMFDADGNFSMDRPSLLNKASALDRHILRLQLLRDGLRHTPRCTQPDHLQCPNFRKLMQAALPSTPGRQAKRPAPAVRGKR